MKPRFSILLLATAAVFAAEPARPNIVFIISEDPAWTD